MLNRMAIAALAGLLLAVASIAPASALQRKTYDEAAVAADQKAGKSIVVHVSAPWCSTCKAQKAAIDAMASDAAYDDVVLYDLDFDSGGDALPALKATSQATLIGYKGRTETGRTVGESSEDSITTLFKSTL